MTTSPLSRRPVRTLPARLPVALQPEEPAVTTWDVTTLPTLIGHLLDLVGPLDDLPYPAVFAVDGRGGAGKTTLTRAITALYPSAQVLCIDDLAWNEPFYQWDYLLVAALTELRQTGVLDLVPPAWQAHHVEGSINIASCPLVIVEGSGAGMRAVNGLIDAHVWVQTDDDVAEQRRIRRDIAEGVNGDAQDSARFWHQWMAAERAFFAVDRPWERADVIVAGQDPQGLADREVAWVRGPLGPAGPAGPRPGTTGE